MVRKVTAYFAFSDVHRAEVREELQAAAGPDSKVNVAAVAQALGKKWKALDDAEKDRRG
jgi:HMG (high mobility group) box